MAEVTDRGRPVAVLVRWGERGLGQLEREGLVRPFEGDLLEIEPVELPPGTIEPSRLVHEGRSD